MIRFQTTLSVLVTLLLISSCKKDLLHFSKVQQLNSNTTARLNNIHFISDKICVIAGGVEFEKSVVTRSTDGGYTWASDSYPDAPKEMFGMGLSPDGTVYLSGVDGDVLHSSDSGRSWTFSRIGDWLVYHGGYFPTRDTGIFVSTVLQRQGSITRVDGNFKIIDAQTHLFGINNIYPGGPSTSYIVGYGAVMKTTNNGNTWNFLDVIGDNFEAVDVHGNELWLCGFNGSIFHSTDGGNSWERLRNGNDISLPRYNLLGILFTDAQNGWCVCDDGRVIRTDDAGHHWMEYDRFTTSALRSIAVCPNNDLLVTGDNGALFRIRP